MRSKERLAYLLIILSLVCGMSYEYHSFSKHYDALKKLTVFIMLHCQDTPGLGV